MVGFVGATKCEQEGMLQQQQQAVVGAENDEDAEMQLVADEDSNSNSSGLISSSRLKRSQQQQQQQQHLQHHWRNSAPSTTTNSDSSSATSPLPPAAAAPLLPHEPEVSKAGSPEMEDDIDEEQLKRILACKRLSEGNCNRHLASLNVCRKNSLHMIGESLPPVTEGEPMRHMSHHMSQTAIEHSQSSSASSGSLRALRHLNNGNNNSNSKRNSHDENATSCSSSTSLDGSGPRSPSRRRSSTVSQCSSVLSEGTRQQLNFDLSPDLAPDSSILEANAISPTDSDRPASPEPSSLGSHTGSFDMRPISRMSQFCDDILADTPASPDSMLADQSTDNANHPPQQRQQQHVEAGAQIEAEDDDGDGDGDGAQVGGRRMLLLRSASETPAEQGANGSSSVTEKLERIITHVSEVKVSSGAAPDRRPEVGAKAQQQQYHGDGVVAAGLKRAHTPFGANIQRSKATHIES